MCFPAASAGDDAQQRPSDPVVRASAVLAACSLACFKGDYARTVDLARHGMEVSGWSPDGKLPEIMEIPDHPWFIGVQFHPELKSRPLEPHPLFTSFISAAVRKSRLV